jgi:hypothetical protein
MLGSLLEEVCPCATKVDWVVSSARSLADRLWDDEDALLAGSGLGLP